jgi:hypothetical protein
MKCCSRMTKCPKQKQQANKNKQCENNGCNPFMACAYGNFYYTLKNTFIFTSLLKNGDKKIPINDNRLATKLSECWHPPESYLHTS